jgi:hypothetical protein
MDLPYHLDARARQAVAKLEAARTDKEKAAAMEFAKGVQVELRRQQNEEAILKVFRDARRNAPTPVDFVAWFGRRAGVEPISGGAKP